MNKVNIIHAGGILCDTVFNRDQVYTNSKEAILYNINIDNTPKIIEIDVVNLKDGTTVIAHDYCEKSLYNLNKNFNDTTYEEFLELKVLNKLTPLTFEYLNDIINNNKHIIWVLDIKGNDVEYEKSIKYICNILQNNISNIVPQVYNDKDVEICNTFGIKQVLFASYKLVFGKNKHIISDKKFTDILDKILEITNRNNMDILGMSIHIDYFNDNNLKSFEAMYDNINIIFHGQQYVDEHKILYDLHCTKYGLFLHNYINAKILDLFDTTKELLFTPRITIINSKTQLYNEFLNEYYSRVFTLLNNNNINYYTFAGTLVGYVRNKKNLPFSDDFDILIFKEDEEQITRNLVKFNKNGLFEGFPHIVRPDLYPSMAGWQFSGLSINQSNFILLDVFLTEVNKYNIIKNTGNFGVYNYKNIPLEYISPYKIIDIDNVKMRTVNNIEKYVEKEYGDVINNCVIHVNHGTQPKIKINSHYSNVYKCLLKYIELAKKNTLNKLGLLNYEHIYEQHLILRENSFKDIFELLIHIKENNIGKISVSINNFVEYSYDIKYYFPDIQLQLYILDKLDIKQHLHYLNYIDHVFCCSKEIYDMLTDNDIIYIKKPNIDMIRVITFGTFDLFHNGHNNLLRRCKEISSEVIVGVSTDEFNKVKGKQSFNNIDKRIEDVRTNKYVSKVFREKSFEEKKDYIKNYNANLLVMGNDWENKFDNLGIMTHYFMRTPGISSTMLRDKQEMSLNNNK